ncbi:ankyrin repeat domain-containing protein [Telmatobacter sp. DSM 110680]|uniref:Ankyrin repeat domain-containing protein n=1 Tax=Telmatobacter sp. DSM 110680 TaxID=3036704 RepID=A0AAU7DNS5_9BACT
MNVKAAIRKGDDAALRSLLTQHPSRANVLIRWGENRQIHTHPLHYVCDMVFDGTLKRGTEVPLIDALIGAGADLNFQRNGKGDTPLIGAASLVAEDVGIRLIEAGADARLRGIFGETALHWAALLGEERLAQRLIPVSEIDLKDSKYNSPPLGWAIHGYYENPKGDQGRQREVAALLVAAGATVEPAWLRSEHVRTDPVMLSILTKGTGR